MCIRDRVIAHFIGRIAEHQHDLLRAAGDAAQADGKPVPAQNREDDADGLSAQMCIRDRL